MPEDNDELHQLRALVENQKAELRHWRTANDLNYGRMTRLADCIRLCVRTLVNRLPDETSLIERCETTLDDIGIHWSFLTPGELEAAGVRSGSSSVKKRTLRSGRYAVIAKMILNNPLTVQEIAANLNINTGTAYNILRTGEEHGLFEQLLSKRWRTRQDA